MNLVSYLTTQYAAVEEVHSSYTAAAAVEVCWGTRDDPLLSYTPALSCTAVLQGRRGNRRNLSPFIRSRNLALKFLFFTLAAL